MRYSDPTLPSHELAPFAEDIRRLFADLERSLKNGSQPSGECEPPLDVFENEGALEVRLDVPGVPASSLRVVVKRGVLLVVGAKTATVVTTRGEATFHVVERDVGRFARAVRLGAAVDVGRARAALVNGELRVTLPKLVERRGRETRIPIDVAPPPTGDVP